MNIEKYKNNTWAIIRFAINNDTPPLEKKNICGTAFIMGEDKNHYYFSIANHSLNKESFIPKKNEKIVKYYLCNSDPSCFIRIYDLYEIKSCDLSFGTIEKKLIHIRPKIENIDIKLFLNINSFLNKEVYICGFNGEAPLLKEKNINIKIDNNKIKGMSINEDLRIVDEGKIIKIIDEKEKINFDDKEISNCFIFEIYIKNPKIKRGQSGGPIILKKNNQVIGYLNAGNEKEGLFFGVFIISIFKNIIKYYPIF